MLATSPSAQQPMSLAAIDGLAWRHIGPASFGGRIDDVEAVEAKAVDIIFVGAASGGILKTVNNGVTWKPVFDAQGTSLSIGDLAIAPSDPNIIWAGTGEPNNRQSSSWGDGVYKSVDGGETWVHMGLRETHHIGRVVIHPTQSRHRVRRRARAPLGTECRARPLSHQAMAADLAAGADDRHRHRRRRRRARIADGRTLYAAAYQRRRRGWGFVGGGPGSGIHRSFDGGDTWQKLAGGLPDGNVGRIGIDISRSASERRLRRRRAQAGRHLPLGGSRHDLDAAELA